MYRTFYGFSVLLTITFELLYSHSKENILPLRLLCLKKIATSSVSIKSRISLSAPLIREQISLLLLDETILRSKKGKYIRAYIGLSQHQRLQNFIEKTVIPCTTRMRFSFPGGIRSLFYQYTQKLYDYHAHKISNIDLLLYILCNKSTFDATNACYLIKHNKKLSTLMQDYSLQIPWAWFAVRYSGEPSKAIQFLCKQGANIHQTVSKAVWTFHGKHKKHFYKAFEEPNESPYECAQDLLFWKANPNSRRPRRNDSPEPPSGSEDEYTKTMRFIKRRKYSCMLNLSI